MSIISGWVLGIAGIICVSVLVELVMPEGQMNKYIKGIFSFVIILVMILPLPKLLKKEDGGISIFNYSEVSLQGDYLYELNLTKLSSITNSIEQDIREMGYQDVSLSISADIFDEKIEYRDIYLNLRNLVITDENVHKDIMEIKDDMKDVVRKYIDEGEVFFEE